MTVDNVHDELMAIEKALSAFDEAPTEEYFGARLMRAGLERRRGQVLASRLAVAPRSAEALALSLQPAGAEEPGVELSLVASVLNSLQETVQAIAQSLKDRPTSRGLVPVEIQEAVRLRVAFALPGSLDLQLVPASPTRQQPLFEDGDETLLQLSLESLFSLLDVASTGEQSELLQHIASLGPRVTTHLDTFTAALSKADAGASLRWRSRGTVRSTRLDSSRATTFNGILKRVSSTTRDRVFTGRVVGGSLVRRTFELELADGSVLTGKVEEHTIGDLEDLFGRDCTATIQVVETALPSGETRETFVLRSLAA